LVALAGLERIAAPVAELGVELAFQHEQDMAPVAPVLAR
jgi:hypothetical protein